LGVICPSDGKADDPDKSETPCGDRGFGVGRRHLTNGGKAEAAGIESASCARLTVEANCGCVECHHPCAARALHPGGPDCHFVSSLDADLQAVIAAWERLPTAIRKAITALLECQK
jgi:hypothetical protein